MTSIRSLFTWILGKLWSVVVVFAILLLGAFVVDQYQDVKQMGQLVSLFQFSRYYN
jgi:hypothetical protein